MEGFLMTFVVHGTVQVRQADKSTQVWINPIVDYKVKHDGKDYIVFVDEAKPSKETPPPIQIFCIDRIFNVDPSLTAMLNQAALSAMKIQIEIDTTHTVIALKIPATTK